MYFCRVASSAEYSGLLIVGRLEWCSIGLCSALPWPKSVFDNRRRSSCSNGWWGRPSTGRCIVGRFGSISSSDVRESRTGSNSQPSSSGSVCVEATVGQIRRPFPGLTDIRCEDKFPPSCKIKARTGGRLPIPRSKSAAAGNDGCLEG